MYNAKITFPSGNCFDVEISGLGTAIYFAKTFGCNVLVTCSLFGFKYSEREG